MNKEEILEKVEEIVDYIKSSDVYKNYLKSRELLSLDKELVNLIDNIKKYQQEIVKNINKKEELELKIKENLNILNESPTYLEYLNYQEELNNMLTIFENKINKYFIDVFN